MPQRMPRDTLVVPAPAKVNLFLHVTGRRDDGYHLLESLFALVDLADTVTLARRDDRAIVRARAVPGVAEHADLAMRAAFALRDATGTSFGASIDVDKRIPIGGGLGGGSSDAASVLFGLNRLWALGLSRAELAGLPAVQVPTAAIFAASELTRSTPSAKINVFSVGYGRNDLEPVAAARYPDVAAALAALGRAAGNARMSGSGSSVFAACESAGSARKAVLALPPGLRGLVVRTLARHPLASFA